AHEPGSELQRSPRCYVPMLGPDSRDRKVQSPATTVMKPGDEIRPDGQARDGGSHDKAQAPLPDATGMTQICRQAAVFDRGSCDPGLGQRNRSADGSDAASPRPSAAPNRVLRGAYDIRTVSKGREGTPRENRAAPTALGRGHEHDLSPARRGL